MKEIEFLARGVVSNAGKALVCRNKKKGNCYLPGGHIEWGESAPAALAREILEETGLTCRVSRFLGAVEHSFHAQGRRTCEINLIFEARIHGCRANRPVPSMDAKLEFFWWPLNRLNEIALQPSALRHSLMGWVRKRAAAPWASTYD